MHDGCRMLICTTYMSSPSFWTQLPPKYTTSLLGGRLPHFGYHLQPIIFPVKKTKNNNLNWIFQWQTKCAPSVLKSYKMYLHQIKSYKPLKGGINMSLCSKYQQEFECCWTKEMPFNASIALFAVNLLKFHSFLFSIWLLYILLVLLITLLSTHFQCGEWNIQLNF